MLPFAHVGIAAFLSTLIALPSLFAAFGGLLPDIFDKTLLLSGVAPCGRFIAHSIFFGPVAALITYAITRRKEFASAILFGCYLHLALDAGDFLPLFYPAVGYIFSCPPGYREIDAFTIIMEVVGAVLLGAAILFRPKIARYGEIISSKLKRYLWQ
jgi:hypothetical protein